VVKIGDCWEWVGAKTDKGYGRFGVDGKVKRSHRAIWEHNYGAIPSGVQCLHKCDNTSCVRLSHLFLGTHADNMADKVKKRRALCGENNGNSKLTSNGVVKMRKMYSDDRVRFDTKYLAWVFGVSVSCVDAVIKLRTWKHLS
jgi:hypothetical protein